MQKLFCYIGEKKGTIDLSKGKFEKERIYCKRVLGKPERLLRERAVFCCGKRGHMIKLRKENQLNKRRVCSIGNLFSGIYFSAGMIVLKQRRFLSAEKTERGYKAEECRLY